MRAGGSAPGWSRFRHARQAGWRSTARRIRRGVAPEHREGLLDRGARLQSVPAAPLSCLESARLVSLADGARPMLDGNHRDQALVA